ncbi:macrophage-expressed gene 1 protein-like [Sinocyclocheilus rhinocerous]|uniref:macrophage-expressed gene 1 protein-like n=1 Tax=Sinocyclocheilus rhinocerous TaxID=307959 RepID=UPI0007B9FB10|nr:PREDICTED: macrophage-expressed gene 1 protein-like [Sinocyclocheilus rhinocerous]
MESLHTFLMLFVVICKSNALIRPSNGLRECRINSTLTALEVLPGGGWDNLRNIDVGRVMNFSYSQCQTTEDGIYLIPDEVFVIPQKTSGVETHSETIMSWLEQKSSTSGSISADISFPPVLNGKFSEENTRMKTHQVRTNSVTTRVQRHAHFRFHLRRSTPSAQDGKVICDELAQKNPDTGGYMCRQPYSASLLHSETVEQGYNQYECHRECHSCWLIFDCCDNVCGNAYYVRRAKINTYWCSTSQTVPQYSGYLFGGLFGPSFQNPQTKSHDCPPNYFAQTFLTNGMRICLSNDYEAGTVSSVPFGGFFSCRSGNPLAGDQYRCPPQYSQHLAAISDGCQVLYCVQSGEFTGGQLKPIRLPPFTRPPLVNMMATNTVAVMTEGDRAWLRVGETKKWRLAKAGEVTQIVRTFQASSTRMSGGEKAGVACGVMTFIAVVVAGIVILVKRRRRFSNFRSSRGYEEIHYEGQSGVESQREQQNTNDNPTQPLLA